MKISNRYIFETLKARNIFPLTFSEVKYAEHAREVILEKLGQPHVSKDSKLYRRVTGLSGKYSKNCRFNWKKGNRRPEKGFFTEEIEVHRLLLMVQVYILLC